MMEGQVLHTTTPYNLGCLKTDIWDKRFEKGTHVETWRSIDRPGFPLERYEDERKRLPPWRFAMMYDAKFDRPAGLIYFDFLPVKRSFLGSFKGFTPTNLPHFPPAKSLPTLFQISGSSV